MDLKYTPKRLWSNSLALILTQGASKVGGFVVMLFLGRFFSISDFGLYTLLIVVTGFASLFTNLGLDSVVTRRLAGGGDINVFWKSLSVKIICSIIVLGLTFAFFLASGKLLNQGRLWFIYLASVLPDGIVLLISSYWMGHQRGFVSGLALVSREISKIIIIIPVVVITKNVEAVGIANLLSSLLVAGIWLSALGFTSYKQKHVGNIYPTRSIISEGLWFSLLGVATMLYYRIDSVLLSIFRGTLDLGEYALSYRLMESTFFLPAAVMGGFFPFVSNLGAGRYDQVKVTARNIQIFLFLLSLPLAIGALLTPRMVLNMIYNKTPLQSVLSLMVLGFMPMIIGYNCIYPVILNSLGRSKITALIFSILLVINIIANLIVIPAFGPVGAACTTVCTELITLFIMKVLAERLIGKINTRLPWLVGCSGGVIIGIALITLQGRANGMIVILLAGIAYAGTLYIYYLLGHRSNRYFGFE
jgi:O-antigen/teichoic acid export membrane protein